MCGWCYFNFRSYEKLFEKLIQQTYMYFFNITVIDIFIFLIFQPLFLNFHFS